MTLESAKLVAAAVLPAIAILLALNWRGRPWGVVAMAVLVGAVAGIPAYHLEKLLTVEPWQINKNFGVLFCFAMFVAGMVEESCKFVAFYAGPGRSKWFGEEYDGILFAGAIATGFATAENVMYVAHGGMGTAWARAFTAVPLHAACGVIMGAYLGLARTRKSVRWNDANLPLTGLGLAILLHGVYDVFAFTTSKLSYGLCFLVVGLAVGWSIWRCREARRRSPSFGGRMLATPPPLWSGPLRLPAAPMGRNPWIAGSLGFIPGVGQLYNGERTKAVVFMVIAAFNLALYYLAYFFVFHPVETLKRLMALGIVPALDSPEQIVAAVEQKWMLVPILLGLVIIWEVVGALDAFLSARQRSIRPQALSVRRSFASHGFGSSYVVHLIAVFLLVFAPIIVDEVHAQAQRKGDTNAAGAKANGEQAGTQSDQQWRLTWVGTPVRIDGWNDQLEGTAKGSEGLKPGAQMKEDPRRGPGMVKVAQRGIPGVPKGEDKSYNEYLSSQIRRNDGDAIYFRYVPPHVWTVVHYTIGRDGSLLNASLVKTSGTPDEAARALQVVRNAAPYAPLPGSASRIEVTELFWSTNGAWFEPGTLEERLSREPDGRVIDPIE